MSPKKAATAKAAPATDLRLMANKIRGTLVEMSHAAEAAHLGGGLSCVDILVAAYWDALRVDPKRPDDPDRDRFILSKGHAVAALYAALAYKGYFPMEDLRKEYGVHGGCLPDQPAPDCAPGVELATGSLGHGLPCGVGMALAGKLKKQEYRTYVLMSDGECNEGSVWEAAMFAPAQNLDRLCVIVDFNKWQATGRSAEITSLRPLKEKFAAFGWSAVELDGHDLGALTKALRNVPDGKGKPVAIIANTVKGKGVSFMEDDNNWHYRIPTAEEVVKAKKELGLL
jgi:transketolase